MATKPTTLRAAPVPTPAAYERIVRELFDAFMTDPVLLPPDYQVASGDVHKQARKIADYIAGMTDRYAIREHKRIFSLDEL